MKTRSENKSGWHQVPGVSSTIGGLLLAAITAAPAAAQLATTSTTTTTTTNKFPSGPAAGPKTVKLVEWNLPAEADAEPGAMAFDLYGTDRSIWFVTRQLEPRVYRMDVHNGSSKNAADWTSWQLDPVATGMTGGLRKIRTSKDKRFVFVRTAVSIQRVDTNNCTYDSMIGYSCERITYVDKTPTSLVSDLAVDDVRNVYSTIAVDPASPASGFVQRLNGATAAPQYATRWLVGGGAGNCETKGLSSSPCLSGVDVHPKYRNLVYYSEPSSDNIGELDTTYSKVRRWSLADLTAKSQDPNPITQPRQLHVDADGIVWVITGSGHLVSLDPSRNVMTKHQMPEGVAADPWGLAPDGGVVGYTQVSPNLLADPDAAPTADTVAMLIPARQRFIVYPVQSDAIKSTVLVTAQKNQAERTSGQAMPKTSFVDARVTRTPEGIFSEAFINSRGHDSFKPMGLTPDQGASVGTFFYAVGETLNSPIVNRVGRVRLHRQNVRAKHERDDDDDDDRDDYMSEDDDDNDGVSNKWDGKYTRESAARYEDEEDSTPGSSRAQTTTVGPTTQLLIASVVSSDPLGNLSVEIVDPLGRVVASSPALPGAAVVTYVPVAAGDYVVRVKNLGLTPARFNTLVITREPSVPF